MSPPTVRRSRAAIAAALLALAGAGAATQAPAAIEETFFDGVAHPAIQYSPAGGADAVARLQRALTRAAPAVEPDPRQGHLPWLLGALDIPIESQLVVFSKTSLQAPRIGPANPRLIFFNDTTVVAWPRGGFVELAVQDARQGVLFYEVRMGAPRPALVPRAECLSCHLGYPTLNVPGTIVRSVATARDGTLLPWLANATIDHRTPTEERWGGWFVTGDSGSVRHLGNLMAAGAPGPEAALHPQPSALASLDGLVPESARLTPHSDIAALLVFDHQMHMMNLLTRVGWEIRIAAADERADPGPLAARLAREMVDYLLFVDEAPLASPVRGTSGFAERFAARGPHDAQGRSLRQLDLTHRLMRYPCSYMIYSEAFDALPPVALDAIYRRLWEVLAGRDLDPRYERLTAADRRAILEILRETKPGLPEYL